VFKLEAHTVVGALGSRTPIIGGSGCHKVPLSVSGVKLLLIAFTPTVAFLKTRFPRKSKSLCLFYAAQEYAIVLSAFQ